VFELHQGVADTFSYLITLRSFLHADEVLQEP
jgi:hypothetical protein